MNEFKTYHPLVNFAYFLCVIGFSCVFMHPVCLGTSLSCAFAYSVILGGRKAIKVNVVYMLPMIAIAAVMNPAFNHEGVTILSYLPDGNPITLESILYGLCAAFMIVSVVCWFSCFNAVITSDKFIYLFGRIVPSLSLVLSMTLRFVKRFTEQLKRVLAAQKGIGRGMQNGNIFTKIKRAVSALSVTVTWALENSVETADSMKSRGYGLRGRTAFSPFVFDSRDGRALTLILLLGVYVLWGSVNGGMYFRYFPSVKAAELSLWSAGVFAAYFALCAMPVIIEIREAAKWKSLKLKA